MVLLLLVTVFGSGCRSGSERTSIRLGYFPNITHGQALIGMEDGRFAEAVGMPVEARIFKAGPAAIEALFAGELDLLYVGPSPAVNGYVRSQGKALHIVSGATSGGAVLVLHKSRMFTGPSSLTGLRLAAPALGNTQDVALRTYLAEAGVDADVVTVASPDMATLFERGDLDGAWVPEPWGTRLAQEAPVRIVLDERALWPDEAFTTAVVVVRKSFLDDHPDLVEKFLDAHVGITLWMDQHPDEAMSLIQAHLTRLLGKGLPPGVLEASLTRMKPTYDPLDNSVWEMALQARKLGYLDRDPELDELFEFEPLERVLRARGLPLFSGTGGSP